MAPPKFKNVKIKRKKILQRGREVGDTVSSSSFPLYIFPARVTLRNASLSIS